MAGRHGGRERASGEQASEGARVPRAAEIPQAPPVPSPEPKAPPAPSGADTARPGHGLVAESGSGSEAQGSGTAPASSSLPSNPQQSDLLPTPHVVFVSLGTPALSFRLAQPSPPTPGDGIGEDGIGWLSALSLVMECTRDPSADTC